MSAGGLSRRLKDGGVGSSTASGRRSDFDSDDSSSGAAAAHHSVGLPASESTPERRGQAGSQRQEISRVLSGTAAAQPAGGARQSWGDVDLDVPPDSPARCGTKPSAQCQFPLASRPLSAAKIVPLPVSIGRCLGASAGLLRSGSRPSSHGPTSCRPTCEAATLALFRLQPRSGCCQEATRFSTALHVLDRITLRRALLFTGLGPPQRSRQPNSKQGMLSVPPRFI